MNLLKRRLNPYAFLFGSIVPPPIQVNLYTGLVPKWFCAVELAFISVVLHLAADALQYHFLVFAAVHRHYGVRQHLPILEKPRVAYADLLQCPARRHFCCLWI